MASNRKDPLPSSSSGTGVIDMEDLDQAEAVSALRLRYQNLARIQEQNRKVRAAKRQKSGNPYEDDGRGIRTRSALVSPGSIKPTETNEGITQVDPELVKNIGGLYGDFSDTEPGGTGKKAFEPWSPVKGNSGYTATYKGKGFKDQWMTDQMSVLGFKYDPHSSPGSHEYGYGEALKLAEANWRAQTGAWDKKYREAVRKLSTTKDPVSVSTGGTSDGTPAPKTAKAGSPKGVLSSDQASEMSSLGIRFGFSDEAWKRFQDDHGKDTRPYKPIPGVLEPDTVTVGPDGKQTVPAYRTDKPGFSSRYSSITLPTTVTDGKTGEQTTSSRNYHSDLFQFRTRSGTVITSATPGAITNFAKDHQEDADHGEHRVRLRSGGTAVALGNGTLFFGSDKDLKRNREALSWV